MTRWPVINYSILPKKIIDPVQLSLSLAGIAVRSQTVLGGLAEYERYLILARTTEGRQRAQQRGVKFGRKPKLTLHQKSLSEKGCWRGLG